MNSEQILSGIAETMTVIKWNLILLNGLMFLIWIRIFIQAGLATKKLVFHRQTQDEFNRRMDELIENCELDNAIEMAERRLSDFKNSRYAYWYLCKIYFEKENFEKVVDYGERLLKLAPYWEDEYVAPMLKKAREKIAAQKGD